MKLMKLFIFLVIINISILSAEPQHFSFTETNVMMTLRIKADATLKIEGNDLETNDEIGVFTQDDVCVGAVVWEDQTVAFNVYGKTTTPPVDGLETDEIMKLKVWDNSASAEYDSVNVTLLDYLGNSTDKKFEPSEPYKDIDILNAYENALDAPQLSNPTDQSTNVSSLTEFDWNDVQNATHYTLQVSTDQTFSTYDRELTNLNSSSATLSSRLQSETVYYWRIKAFDQQTESEWSSSFSYTTNSKHTISLTAGWNLISSNLIPENNNIESIFSSIENNIDIVKNNDGTFISAQNINTLSTWNYKKAYLVYANTSVDLNIYGEEADPAQTVISLSEGWNYVAYLHNSSKSASNMLNPIFSNLLIAREGYNKAYIPWFGINSINNMDLGKGYLIYVDSSLNFTYPN